MGIVEQLRHSRLHISAKRALAASLTAAVRRSERPPGDVRALCRALCAAMSQRRGGRPVELRFERFPDGIGVTGLWVEFQDFDLVIVEERAEEVQQLVVLGHELWHLHAGHRHQVATPAAARALAGRPGWKDLALGAAARGGSRAGSRSRDEAEADGFGHRLAALCRDLIAGTGPGRGTGAGDGRSADALQRSLGHPGRNPR
ncbi:toxin-antitoxin system, toxin component family protein [Streptomyces sp. Ru71]|uniref:toxin-antitoxin system, toxin component family protein n=1 Tax=Streptomyces sp. Ru71 TaxID=2080746 RepID=UPI000CDD5C0E|nr:toxin-antitoxin system, toxin component family protein [Streptomyces sp. Ru71]POX53796.1 toxin-antitoxin system, toxin component family protein [Streptomyces sp. Ru71]